MDSTVKIKRRRKVSLEKKKARAGYVFVAPFLLGILLIYIPILLDSIWFSFNQLSLEIRDGIPTQVLVPTTI